MESRKPSGTLRRTRAEQATWAFTGPKAPRLQPTWELVALRELQVLFPGRCFPALLYQEQGRGGEGRKGAASYTSYTWQVTLRDLGGRSASGTPGGRLEAGFTKG